MCRIYALVFALVFSLPLLAQSAPPELLPAGLPPAEPLTPQEYRGEITPVQFTQPQVLPNTLAPNPALGNFDNIADPPVPVVKIQVRMPKDASPTAPVKCTLIVTNSTNVDAYEVRVRVPLAKTQARVTAASPKWDAMPAGATELTWTFGKLKANSNEKIELTMMPEANATALSVRAYVRFEHGQQVETKLTPAKLVVEKNAPKEVAPGEAIPVRLVIRNSGPVLLKDLRVVETVSAGYEFNENTDGEKTKEPNQREWKFESLRPGEARSLAFTLTPKAGQNAGLSTATVVVAADGTTTRKESITEIKTPSLKVDLSAPRTADANEASPVRVTVSNAGSMTLNAVRVVATFPADSTVTKMTEGGRQYKDQIVWTIPKLAPTDAPREFRLWLKPKAPGRTAIKATATDARGTTNSATGDIGFMGTANLTWETIPDPARVQVGNYGTFTIKVRNTGGDDARRTTVRVKLPPEVTATQISPKYNMGGDEVVFQAVTIPSGASETYTITFKGVKAGAAYFDASLGGDALGDKPLKAEKSVTVVAK